MQRCTTVLKLTMLSVLSTLTLLMAQPRLTVPTASAQQPPGPIRLVPTTPGASIRLSARFPPRPGVCPARQPAPLEAAYGGTIEIGRRSGGQLYLITELTFPEYLNGIAEVPRDWPMEALKAQVVAARTYAMSNMKPSTPLARELRYDLCSTDACQVYRGLSVQRGPWGSAWSRAVAETAGQILEYRGKPANTLYFSTSNGQTYSNADVFSPPALPYLRPVKELDDRQSPFSSWQVRMPLADLAETLRRAASWGNEPIEAVAQKGDSVLVSGGGMSRSFTLIDFRSRLNAQAVCLTPKRYPTDASNGRPLPQVIPSRWMTLEQQGRDVVISGKGWGHGVGMVQWGLKGKAERGMSYSDMLAFYYGGLRPVPRPEPARIRVSLATDLQEITLERRGGVRVEGAAVPDGPFRLTGGPAMTISPAAPIEPRLRVDKLGAPAAAGPGQPVTFSFQLSGPANVQLQFTSPSGRQGATASEPRDRGPQTYAWNPGGMLPQAPLEPGSYLVSLVADDGVDRVAAPPVPVSISGPAPSPSPAPVATAPRKPPRQPAPRSAFSTGMLIVATAGILVLLTAGIATFSAFRRGRSPD